MLAIKLMFLVHIVTIANAESEIGYNNDYFPSYFDTTRNRNFRQVSQPYNRIPRPIPRPGLQRITTTTPKPETSTEIQLVTLPTLTAPFRRPGFSLWPKPYIPNILPAMNKPTTPIQDSTTPEYSAAKEAVSTISSNEPQNEATNFLTPVAVSNRPHQLLTVLPDSATSSESTPTLMNTEPPQIVALSVQTTENQSTSTDIPSTPEPPGTEISFNFLLPLESQTAIVPVSSTTANPFPAFRFTLPSRYPNRPDWIQSSTTSNPKENVPILIQPTTEPSLSSETVVSSSTPKKEIIGRPRPIPLTPTEDAVIPSIKAKLPKPAIINTKPLKTYPDLTTITSLAEPFDYSCKPGINAFYSVTDDCDSYIQCKKNIATKHVCPDGLHFNPKVVWPEFPCAYPSEVQCNNNTFTQNSQPTNECPRQYGYFAVNNEACDSYIICQEGKATIMKCPTGLAYNPATTSCDWPINVPTCNLNVFNGFECPEPPLDEFGMPSDIVYKYRYQSSCKEYVACQLRRPRLLSCDPGLSFDEDSGSCIDSDLVKECAGL